MAYILVIDDDPALRRIYELMLLREGHMVALAENGRDGIERLEERRPDAVLTDLSMPVLDGIAFISAASGLSPGLPIIAMSGGFAAEERLAEALASGALMCLPKPFALERLRAAVEIATQTVRCGGAGEPVCAVA